eukprot:5506759-Pyramimonas_sp.AAC.2
MGMSGVENHCLERAARFALHGPSEDVSDMQSEGGSSHSIENGEEHAQFHATPGPSHHLDLLPDRCVGLASGADPLANVTVDRATVETIQQA